MTEANRALTKSDGGSLTVIGVDSKLPEFLPLWVAASGGSLLSEDGRTASLDSQEAIDSLTWAVGIYDDQGGFSKVKAFRDSADFFGERQPVRDERARRHADGAVVHQRADRGLARCPDGVRHRAHHRRRAHRLRGRLRVGDPLGHPEPAAACRWAKAMTEVDAWKAAADARLALREEEGTPFTGILTGNSVADEQIREMVTSGGEPWDSRRRRDVRGERQHRLAAANPADAEFEQAMQDAVNSVLNGEATPEEALAEAQDTAQKALDEGWQTLEERGAEE